ncbi:MAG: hypothetical protein ACWGOD_02865 [Desulfobulbales bacterium]
MSDENIVQEIMEEFRNRTGLLIPGAEHIRRYLWTDAFGVCNYLGLYRLTGRDEYLHLALGLVDQVHEILGRHREDDSRHGWISSLEEREGRLHPTAGGLRIGKKLPERPPEEPFDENLEWERDGQYFHYLTKWMHALCCVSRTIDNQVYSVWAGELAERAYNTFSYTAGDNSQHMYWKMSIDLSRPQVSSMGHHDPLDGLVTFLEIREQIRGQSDANQDGFGAAITELAEMCRGVNWTTPDPLGLGGLLADAYRLVQLQVAGTLVPLPGLVQDMLDAAAVGLSIYLRDNSLHLGADYRLAFRELGLAIGLQGLDRLKGIISRKPDLFGNQSRLESLLEALDDFRPLREQIENFWLEPENREVDSWKNHADINMVMLATSLLPDVFLEV